MDAGRDRSVRGLDRGVSTAPGSGTWAGDVASLSTISGGPWESFLEDERMEEFEL